MHETVARVLSVDWDYFFPDVYWFDWSQKEESMVFLEYLWPLRYGNVHMKTGEEAKDIVKPDQKLLKNFWQRACPLEPSMHLCIAESHKDILMVLENFFESSVKFSIWNFDQHHDAGYDMEKLNCDNWVRHLRENKRLFGYTVIYPPWRRESPEDGEPNFVHQVFYEIPTMIYPRKFEIVFTCRSSGWTPSWCDDEWIKFIEYWKRYDYLWETKSSAPYALKKRPFDYKKAEENLKKEREIIRQVRENNLKIMKERGGKK